MTQIQMEYFIKTCEFGNIAQAADALFVSRSAVSRAISDLEKEFQAELLTRSKNGVTPTNAGQIVLEMAKNVSSSYQGVVRRIRELEDWRLFHQVRVGITPTNNLQVYQNYLRQYALDSPGVKLVLTEECASRCLELLSLGQVDVTFIPSGIIRDQPDMDFFSGFAALPQPNRPLGPEGLPIGKEAQSGDPRYSGLSAGLPERTHAHGAFTGILL